MSRTPFPLFSSHLDFARRFWESLVKKGDIAIDATSGNGHDTLLLSRLALTKNTGTVYSFDNQEEAIVSTRALLKSELEADLISRIHLEKRCHSRFPEEILPETVTLIVYNLGYLPGGNKNKTTLTSTTLESMIRAGELLVNGGVLSVTCYPGHPEGESEQEALLAFALTLSPRKWSCTHHRWCNRERSPSVIFIQKCESRNEDPIR